MPTVFQVSGIVKVDVDETDPLKKVKVELKEFKPRYTTRHHHRYHLHLQLDINIDRQTRELVTNREHRIEGPRPSQDLRSIQRTLELRLEEDPTRGQIRVATRATRLRCDHSPNTPNHHIIGVATLLATMARAN